MVCRVCALSDGRHLQAGSTDALGAGLFSFQGILRQHPSYAQTALAPRKPSIPGSLPFLYTIPFMVHFLNRITLSSRFWCSQLCSCSHFKVFTFPAGCSCLPSKSLLPFHWGSKSFQQKFCDLSCRCCCLSSRQYFLMFDSLCSCTQFFLNHFATSHL